MIANSDEGVDITDKLQVEALSLVQQEIEIVSSAVTECVNSGGDHNECLCASGDSIDDFKLVVESLFATYPNLRSYDLIRFRDADGNSSALSLSGIKAQAELELNCG
jgi:hypothetical protein